MCVSHYGPQTKAWIWLQIFAHWRTLRSDGIGESLAFFRHTVLGADCVCQEPCGICRPMTQSKWRLWTMPYMPWPMKWSFHILAGSGNPVKIVSHAILSGSRYSPTQLAALGNIWALRVWRLNFWELILISFKKGLNSLVCPSASISMHIIHFDSSVPLLLSLPCVPCMPCGFTCCSPHVLTSWPLWLCSSILVDFCSIW